MRALPSYMPELDGLRALAIVLVILFHQQVRFFSLGWAGVFLFFVISGFLITGILLDARDKPCFFRNFYVRRALRIFPLYYFSFALILSLGLWRGASVDNWPYYLVYMQNGLIGATDFLPAFPHEFNHSWSLAVEEQFYLVWPLAVFLLSRVVLTWMCVACIVLAPVARYGVLTLTATPSLVFTPLACVCDSLAWGGLLALMVRGTGLSHPAKWLPWCAALAAPPLVCLVLATGPVNYWTPAQYLGQPNANVFLYSLLSLFFAGLIALAVLRRGVWSRALSWAPLRHIGKISYGLYLYHFPILVFSDYVIKNVDWLRALSRGHRLLVICLEWLLIYGAASLSWKWFELKFLALKSRFA